MFRRNFLDCIEFLRIGFVVVKFLDEDVAAIISLWTGVAEEIVTNQSPQRAKRRVFGLGRAALPVPSVRGKQQKCELGSGTAMRFLLEAIEPLW